MHATCCAPLRWRYSYPVELQPCLTFPAFRYTPPFPCARAANGPACGRRSTWCPCPPAKTGVRTAVKTYASWGILQTKSCVGDWRILGTPTLLKLPNVLGAQVAKEVAAAVAQAARAVELGRKERFIEAQRAAARWQNWEISNFDYLMRLNTLAGDIQTADHHFRIL